VVLDGAHVAAGSRSYSSGTFMTIHVYRTSAKQSCAAVRSQAKLGNEGHVIGTLRVPIRTRSLRFTARAEDVPEGSARQLVGAGRRPECQTELHAEAREEMLLGR
jgi:hypothetical protein